VTGKISNQLIEDLKSLYQSLIHAEPVFSGLTIKHEAVATVMKRLRISNVLTGRQLAIVNSRRWPIENVTARCFYTGNDGGLPVVIFNESESSLVS
jgi:hypothetical protein